MASLGAVRKPGAGVPAYTRWVNRGLARYAAAAAYRWGVSANGVTILSAVMSAVAIALIILAPPRVLVGVAAAVLFAIGYLLDSADGQVARLSRQSSPAGEWLDHVVDAIRSPAIHLAALVGLWRQGGPRWVWVVAMLYCLMTAGQFMSQILAEQLSKSKATPLTHSGIRQSLLLLPSDPGVLCWLFLLWGAHSVFVPTYTAIFALNLLHTGVSMRRKYVKLKLL